jgi:glycyl-tRNA synthetase beta subunit
LRETEKQIYGNPAVFKKCRGDKKFAFVVALARAVNALNSAHSLMMNTTGRNDPAALRDRMNSYFFVSAILYETLILIRKMSSVYGRDKSFQDSLQMLLKDKTAKALEQSHLKATRHDAVFHYLPDRFEEAIAKTPMTECVFLSSFGQKKGSLHYTFADLIAAEIGVGTRIDNTSVVNDMMENTLTLVKQFIDHSENFIGDQLNAWGFEVRPAPPASPGNQSRG